ncbi:NDR1/HIN1-like protein 13 [Phoenix dactylifera]|uniref:NDR1/HIN1-like protein 13 n=1 Tax=Phoenix dactylifera TaxID=42345 RepID=A0A8B7BP39_PHODC|nr:NDR1/HIN1-like protein 13 [Phoenix dactylifera]
MADRVFPSSKPNPQPPQAVNGSGGPPSFPTTKAQAYGATRPRYRPQPMKPRRRSSRSCCCACCLWLTLILIALVLLAAIAGGVFYFLYRPRRPDFTVSSLRLAALNVTASNHLASRLDLSVTARNPNKKLVYLYDPISIAVSSGGVDVGDGSFPAFVHDTKNTTILKTTVSSSGESVDPSAAADLKKKSKLPLEIDLETKAGVKIGGLKTKKIGIKVHCEGIDVAVPKGKTAPSPSSPDVMCKVKLRIKIWKWTF